MREVENTKYARPSLLQGTRTGQASSASVSRSFVGTRSANVATQHGQGSSEIEMTVITTRQQSPSALATQPLSGPTSLGSLVGAKALRDDSQARQVRGTPTPAAGIQQLPSSSTTRRIEPRDDRKLL